MSGVSGMHAVTGGALDDLEHLRQSIRDILATPLGSRVMRRDYGSLLPELIDHAGNAVGVLRLMAATVGAIARWEPRVCIVRIGVDLDSAGNVVVDLDGIRRDGPRSGAAVALSIRTV